MPESDSTYSMIVRLNWFAACLRLVVLVLWFVFTVILFREIPFYQRLIWPLIVGYLGASILVTVVTGASFFFSRFLFERQIRLAIMLRDHQQSDTDRGAKTNQVGLEYSTQLTASSGASFQHVINVTAE